MHTKGLLEQIWTNGLEVRGHEVHSPLIGILAAILDRPILGLVASEGFEQPIMLNESEEISAGLTLGDILEEEFGVEVEVDTVVLIEPVQLADADVYTGRDLGSMLGTMLVNYAGFNPIGHVSEDLSRPAPHTVSDANALHMVERTGASEKANKNIGAGDGSALSHLI